MIPKIITAQQSTVIYTPAGSVYVNRVICIHPQTLNSCPGFPCSSLHGPTAYAEFVCVSNASPLMDTLFSFFFLNEIALKCPSLYLTSSAKFL